MWIYPPAPKPGEELGFQQLDESGINESRACFESYDPDIIIRTAHRTFGKLLTEEAATAEPEGPSVIHTDYTKLQIAVRHCVQLALEL